MANQATLGVPGEFRAFRPLSWAGPRRSLSFVFLLLLTACSGGGGGGGGGGGEFGDDEDDDLGPGPQVEEGTVIAFLETDSFDEDEVTLRGTIPIPPGTYPRPDGKGAFTVVQPDGSSAFTQTEIVSRYPTQEAGADVVEVIARVQRDTAQTGDRTSYAVKLAPQDSVPDPGALDLNDLLEGPEAVPQSVVALLSNPDYVRVRATDCFGNEYVFRPFGDDIDGGKLMRHGILQSTARLYGNLDPEPAVDGPQGTLPHFLGVHAYVSTFSEEHMIGFDLRFHNGHSGADAGNPDDDPLDKVYFEKIELTVPVGWTVVPDYADPYFDGFQLAGNDKTYQLVRPMDDGSMHVIKWQGQFHRRLMISRVGEATGKAINYMAGGGQAFCRRGTDADDNKYWSWWNEDTARYFPQRQQLPSLEHLGLGNLENFLFNEWDRVRGHLENGTSEGNYPFQSVVMGWCHPYGVAYGGMTGGNEVFMYDGLRTAEAGSTFGYRMFQGIHRMHSARQPNVFYDADGSPSSVESWLVEVGGDMDYIPFEHYIYPKLNGNDAAGLYLAPQFQIQHVENTGLVPGYEQWYMPYDAHDYQHFIRYTRSAKVLAWLGNDPLAKDDLLMQAESYNLSYHPYRNSQFGNVQGSGMRSARNYVDTYFANGFPFGRGEGWGIDAMTAAYSTATPAWRARKRSWFDSVSTLVSDGQVPCSGFIQAIVGPKFVGGNYRARQMIEHAIIDNAFRSIRETVYRGQDSAYFALLTDVFESSLYAEISDMAWYPGEGSPRTYTAIGPLGADNPAFCSWTQIPADGWDPNLESYQNWSSFGYGYEETGDPAFLDKAQLQSNSNDLFTALMTGSYNIENEAALLALMQRLNGVL